MNFIKPGRGRDIASLSPFLMAAVLLPSAAFASTAANTQIANTATVNFNDAGGVAQTAVTATATVTVTLVPSAVTINSPANQTIAQGTSATLTYTITSSSNGQDTYNLTSTATPGNNSSVTPTLPASVTLGGTTLAADAVAGQTSITVPYDNTANGSGGNVNGIVVGDTIVIGGNVYTVASLTDNGTASTTIGLTTAITGATVTVGNIVGEQQTFTETVPSGTIVSGSTGTQTVSTTATSATSPNPATTQTTPTVITVNRPTLTVSKLVSVDGGATFGASGNAAPGTSLIYKIVATNTGTTPASSVAFTDVLPPYLTYVTTSGKFATSAATTYAASTALTEGSGGYTATTSSGVTTVSYNPGGATGTVAGSGVLVLFFRATID